MASVHEDEPGDDSGSGLGEDLGQRGSAKQYHLRPVDGKGLKPIPIRDGETKVVGRNPRFGILDERIAANQLECRLVFAPELALEVKAINEIYVKDRFGVLKMLKTGFLGYVQRGNVLYLTRAEGVPMCGYVLTKGSPDQPEKAPSKRGKRGGECIDLADESDSELRTDSEDEIEIGPDPRQEAKETERRATHASTSSSSEDDDPPTPGAKGTKENPCELLSSDDEDEVVVERETQGNKPRKSPAKPRAKPTPKEPAAKPAATARRKPANPASSSKKEPPLRSKPAAGQSARSSHFGGGAAQGAQPQPSTTTPQRPLPAQPSDYPDVAAARVALLKEWNDWRQWDEYYRNLVNQLNLAQQQYRDLVARQVYGLNPQLSMLINQTTGNAHQLLNKVNEARARCLTVQARHKSAEDELNSRLAVMERNKRNAAQQRQGEATANDFQEEIRAWELVEKTEDLTVFPAGELRRIAKAMGIDITGLLEKDEFVKAVADKREGGREAWAVRKRKRTAEEDIASRQRTKLAELRQNESKKLADEFSEVAAKAKAVTQVKTWAHGADLQLFFQRCGIKVDGNGKTKKHLQGAYRRAMLKFHPDRTRTVNKADRTLAAEVTKWITHEWQTLK